MPRLRAVARWVIHLWPVFLIRYQVRETYRALPGPRWVKVSILVACLLFPGPWDELILLAVVSALGARRARRARLPA